MPALTPLWAQLDRATALTPIKSYSLYFVRKHIVQANYSNVIYLKALRPMYMCDSLDVTLLSPARGVWSPKYLRRSFQLRPNADVSHPRKINQGQPISHSNRQLFLSSCRSRFGDE